MNIHELIDKQAGLVPNKPAIIFKHTTVTFAQLRHEVHRLAGAFQATGIRKSQKVAIYMPNCPQYIFAYFAVFSLGSVVVPLDFMLTEQELINFMRHSECSLLLAKDKKGINFNNIINSCPSLESVVFAGGLPSDCEPSARFMDWQPPNTKNMDFVPPEIFSSDEAAIFYTSGSTGKPKGVLLTLAHLDNPINAIKHFLGVDHDDSYLCAGIPFSHIGGLDYIMYMLYFASTLVLMERFQPFEALKNIQAYRVTVFCVVPAMFIAMLSLKESDSFDLTSLRHLAVFGAPSSPTILKRFHQLCPNARLSNGWGMTETAAPNTYSPDDVHKINSIGPFGLGMEARIVSQDGRTLKDGEKGELWVRGDAVMLGYYREDALTKQVMTPEGWLKTGDIAYRDEDGNYYLSGRIREMIKVAGEIVMAPEVESVFFRHPKVKDVAIIGVADKMRGEVPKAFVVLKENESLSVDELRQFLKGHLAHFKLPHHIEFRGSLPKNRTGKIDKEILKKEEASCSAS